MIHCGACLNKVKVIQTESFGNLLMYRNDRDALMADKKTLVSMIRVLVLRYWTWLFVSQLQLHCYKY